MPPVHRPTASPAAFCFGHPWSLEDAADVLSRRYVVDREDNIPFEQDQSGQWWYIARSYRTRAYPQACAKCGKTFLRKTGDDARYCSHRCHLLRGGHPNWKGGRTMQKGYVLVRVDDRDPIALAMTTSRGYVPEHRLVLAKALGR